MKRSSKSRTRKASVRQSDTATRALVVLAQRGVEAEAAARDDLNATYRRFMVETDPERKGEVGKDLIRAIFGKDAIAEGPIL